jgi:TetR/AcrR family transcriptional regulator, mexJK operon transcriptional repressor
MGRRQGPSEERRAVILAAAEAVFSEQGYHGASIRAIARRAGVSSGLLYWFFPNKAKLFAAVLLAQVEAQGGFEPPAEALDVPPEVLLPRIARRQVALLGGGEMARLMRLVLRDSDREPELVAEIAQTIVQRILAPVGAYLGRQIALGRLRPGDPDHMAQIFLGPTISLILRRYVLQEPASQTWDLQEFADTAALLFLRGAVLPPGAAGAEPASAAPLPGRTAIKIPIQEE